VRKALLFAAPLAAVAMAWSGPVKAQEPFKDLDRNHWAYQAVVDLQQKGILIGYPGDYFKGKRTLTRYEFAIAIRRLLDHLPTTEAAAGPAGPQGPAGDVGPAGPPGPGIDQSELDNVKKLVDEFKNELQGLGVRVGDIEKRLDALTKDVDAIKTRLDRMIHFTGDVFFGFRGDSSRYPFADYSGAARDASKGYFANVEAVHDFHLGVNANLAGDVKFKGDIVISNYLDTGALNPPATSFAAATTTGLNRGTNGIGEQVGLYEADLSIPLKSIKTTMDIGRIKQQNTPLTMWRPDYDPYFDLPWYDDGNYIMDGVRLSSKFGSASTQIWAGTFSNSLTDSVGQTLAPRILPVVRNGANPLTGNYYAAATSTNPNPAGLGFWPLGLATAGSAAANENAGLHINVPIGHIGEVGLSLIDFNTADGVVPNELVYGVNFRVNPAGRFHLEGEAAKSVFQDGIGTGAPGAPNDSNNAYRAKIGWASGGLDATFGFSYIDPNFAAPGYWDKIGNWYNPTNVMGPFVKIAYTKNKLSAVAQADALEGARNRYFTGGENNPITTTDQAGGFGIGDRLYRGKAGVSYRFNKTVNLSIDYEAVVYRLTQGASAAETLTDPSTGLPYIAPVQVSHPLEQFLTFGLGVNVSGNTDLKFGYQLINLADDYGAFGTANPAFGNSTSNASVFTTQLAVHF
jgi:hypothetical protein